VAVRSLHIPAAPSRWTYGTGLIVVAAYLAANYVFHRTPLGDALRGIPFVYFVGLYLTFAVAPVAGLLAHLAAGRPAALGWLGLGLGPRDLSAIAAAITLGGVVASFGIESGTKTPGVGEVSRLYANLLIESASDALIVLGVAGNLLLLGLREQWRDSPPRGPEAITALVAVTLFGLLHLCQPPPLDGFENAPLLASGWISAAAIFLLTRSLIAAIPFLATLSLIGVTHHSIEILGTMESGFTRIAIALVLFIGTLWLSNLGRPQRGRRA
jgi:hypothetical protein